MKSKHILVSIALVLFSITSIAQGRKAKLTLDEKANKYTKEISDYVSNVDSNQYTKLLTINKQVSQKFDSLYHLELEYSEKRGATKQVLNAKQFDEFLMLQAEKKAEAAKRWKQKSEVADSNAYKK
jgi:hypothetical protein